MITPMFNQAETATHLYNVLKNNRAALDASDTGVGKSYAVQARILSISYP